LLNGVLHGRAEMEDRLEAIAQCYELGEFVDAPRRAYSSSMQLRLGSAIERICCRVMALDEHGGARLLDGGGRDEPQMTRPEQALAHARAEAARKRAAGGYARAGAAALDDSIVSGPPSPELLSRWAVVEGDARLLYSTRRAGGPVTVLKRLIVRLLRQYLADVESRQTRFNIALLAGMHEHERRIGALERAADAGAADARPGRPTAGPRAPARPAAPGESPGGGSTDVPD